MHIVKGFAAIRKSEAGEWLDSRTFGLKAKDSQFHVDLRRVYGPDWDDENPVIGIVSVTMTEDATKDA